MLALLSHWRWIAVGGLAALAMFGVGWILHRISSAYEENLRLSTKLLQTQAQVREMSVANEEMERSMNLLLDSTERAREEAQRLSQDLAAYREESEKQMTVLQSEGRLARLAAAKPGLIERLANSATAERFAELEEVLGP